MDLDTEDTKDAIALLEEVVNSNILNPKKINIRTDKIIKNKKNFQKGGNNVSVSEEKTSITASETSENSSMSETSENSSMSETSENSSITGDSMTIGHISVPSEIFMAYKKGKKIDTQSNSHNSSHYNLAFSDRSKDEKSDNDFANILDYNQKNGK